MITLFRCDAVLLFVTCGFALFSSFAGMQTNQEEKDSGSQKSATKVEQEIQPDSEKERESPVIEAIVETEERGTQGPGRIVSDSRIPLDPKSGAIAVPYPCVYKRGTCFYYVY